MRAENHDKAEELFDALMQRSETIGRLNSAMCDVTGDCPWLRWRWSDDSKVEFSVDVVTDETWNPPYPPPTIDSPLELLRLLVGYEDGETLQMVLDEFEVEHPDWLVRMRALQDIDHQDEDPQDDHTRELQQHQRKHRQQEQQQEKQTEGVLPAGHKNNVDLQVDEDQLQERGRQLDQMSETGSAHQLLVIEDRGQNLPRLILDSDTSQDPPPRKSRRLMTDKAPSGMRNFGNTCHLTAALQLVQHTCIRELLLGIPESRTWDHAIHYFARRALEGLRLGEDGEEMVAIGATGMLAHMCCPLGVQQDAGETLFKILQCTREAGLSHDPGAFDDMLGVRISKCGRCSGCGQWGGIDNPPLDLCLDVQAFTEAGELGTLQDCMDAFVQPEMLTVDCEFCECDQRSATPQLLILPSALVIRVKRTRWNDDTKEPERLDHPVEADLVLRVPAVSSGMVTYDLTGVIYHAGRDKNADSGHYFTEAVVHGDWFLFDDHNVKPSPNWDTTRVPAIRKESTYKKGLVSAAVYVRRV